WRDHLLRIRWRPHELEGLADARLAEVFRGQYTNEPPTLRDILPAGKKGGKPVDPVDYVMERTLMRPRDLIDLVNTCFDEAANVERLSWGLVRRAEVDYAARRLRSL